MRLNLFLPKNDTHKALRKVLAVLGPTWSASPTRRIIQVVCLAGFLVLLFHVCWPYGSRDYAAAMQAKELIEVEIFLALDPLLSVSTALAARAWVWSLSWAAVIVLICLVIPRGFCGYVCPLGTLLDIFDWAVGHRIKFMRLKTEGWWTNLRYYILVATLVAAVFGLLLSGFVSAIPIVTRGMVFVFGPVQLGLLKDWYLVSPMNAGYFVSIALFVLVLVLGFLQPRFWCRYICPTGAMFSIANFLRLSERKVDATCIECGRCTDACSFSAIGPDYETRTFNCTFCQTCGGICPKQSINFTARWDKSNLKLQQENACESVSCSRRGFLAGVAGATAAGIAVPVLVAEGTTLPVRPPGSVPEDKFLQLCIRCGECFKACPNNVLQPIGFDRGFDALWTPQVVADWAGCEVTCNNCGQVCPTGAIRALPPDEKRAARIALAFVNEQTCLPYAGREDCRMCVDECASAGYNAIEFVRVGGEIDADGAPVEGSGYLAPVVLADKCVGCGLCQMRCHSVNVKSKKLLKHSAIRMEAGPGKEDRIMKGSYLALQKERAKKKAESSRTQQQDKPSNDYLPDFLK
ncbi:MAG: 4Fe-4S dicluster domain-containing protein [Planctomycetota bacterium]|jgi:ferredoxin-type protein NapF